MGSSFTVPHHCSTFRVSDVTSTHPTNTASLPLTLDSFSPLPYLYSFYTLSIPLTTLILCKTQYDMHVSHVST